MKKIFLMLSLLISVSIQASIPTEEGLLKNLNNANIPGSFITIKTTSGEIFYKFLVSLESNGNIGLLQMQYSNSQMLANQLVDVKYSPDLIASIKKERSAERGLFYGVLTMLTTNRSAGMEVFLEKNGVEITKNKNLINEDKLKLLRAYRGYLVNNKGKGEANSPLNPQDPETKAKILELFKSSTYQRAKNIELVKENNEFMWKADWKQTTGFFTNEERRLRMIEHSLGASKIKIEASDYTLFNGTNEFPKFITFISSQGNIQKMQTISFDVKQTKDKPLSEKFEEAKKYIQGKLTNQELNPFLF